jgi:hypothetical protein
MRTLPNSASRRSCTSASLSNNEKHPSMTKPQDQPARTTTSEGALSKYTTSTLTVVGLRKTGKRILGHSRKKGVRGTSIIGQSSITREGACQDEAMVMAEAHTHSSLHTVCIMAMIPITAQKTVPYSLNLKERWSKTPRSSRNSHHPEK